MRQLQQWEEGEGEVKVLLEAIKIKILWRYDWISRYWCIDRDCKAMRISRAPKQWTMPSEQSGGLLIE